MTHAMTAMPKYERKKIKYLCDIENGNSLNEQKKSKYSFCNSENLSYISSKDIDREYATINYDTGLSIPADENGFKTAPLHSTLLCIEGGSAGKKVAFTEKPVYYVNKLASVSVKTNMHAKYIFYFIRSRAFQDQFFQSMTGLIGGASISSIKNFFISEPPIEEQIKIVNFLDEKIQKVDDAIKIKKQQIVEFKNLERIKIQRALTRGMDDAVETKISNIDWIGDIPKHWKEVRFKYIFSQSRLPVDPNDEVVTAYRDGQVTLRSNRRIDGYTEAILEQGYQGIRNGQLVLNSMDAFEGAIGVSDSNGKCTPEYVVCNPTTDKVSQFYYAYLLREMALSGYIQVICNAVRQRAIRIRYSNLAPLFMIMPPLDEQKEIVLYIENEKAKIKTGILNFEQQIDKLTEYKASLINGAVTGKIKVI